MLQSRRSNGEPIYFRVGFKPPATIGQAQNSMCAFSRVAARALYDVPAEELSANVRQIVAVDFTGKEGVLEAKGRHDPCVVPRAVSFNLHSQFTPGCDMAGVMTLSFS